MKTIAVKNTTDIRLNDALSSFVARFYEPHDAASLTSTLELIDKCRKNVVTLLQNPTAPHELNLEALRTWLSYIVFFEDQFPFRNCPYGINIEFEWTSAFDPKLKTTHSSLEFEKCSILFNIATAHCSLADKADRTTADGVKEAIGRLQATLLPNLRLSNLTPDLTESGLSVYLALLSAQGHKYIYEKAVKDKLNRSLLSKLANQVANFYSTALSISSLIPEFPSSLVGWLKIEQMAFLSAAHYQRAMFDWIDVEKRSDGYGPLISRLRCAWNICAAAIQKAKEVSLTVDLDALQEAIKKVLDRLEKDNSMVYLEVVPSESDLPSLESVCALSFNEPTSLKSICVDVPEISECLSSIFSTKVKPYIEEFHSSIDASLKDVKESIVLLNSDIEAFYSENFLPFIMHEESKGTLPESLWQIIKEAQAAGGFDTAMGLLRTVAQKTENTRNALDSLQCKLKQRANTLWRPPSTEVFWKTIEKYNEKWTLASQANQIVMNSLQQATAVRESLLRSRELIEASFRKWDTGDQPTSDRTGEVMSALESLGCSHNELKSKELELDLSLRDSRLRLSGCITKSLNLDKSPIQMLMKQEVENFKNTIASVKKHRDACLKYFEKSASVWKQYQLSSVPTQEKLHLLKALDSGAAAVIDVCRNSQEGLEFFDKLSNLIEDLSEQVDDWLLSKKDHMLELPQQQPLFNSNQAFFRSYASPSANLAPSSNTAYSHYNLSVSTTIPGPLDVRRSHDTRMNLYPRNLGSLDSTQPSSYSLTSTSTRSSHNEPNSNPSNYSQSYPEYWNVSTRYN